MAQSGFTADVTGQANSLSSSPVSPNGLPPTDQTSPIISSSSEDEPLLTGLMGDSINNLAITEQKKPNKAQLKQQAAELATRLKFEQEKNAAINAENADLIERLATLNTRLQQSEQSLVLDSLQADVNNSAATHAISAAQPEKLQHLLTTLDVMIPADPQGDIKALKARIDELTALLEVESDKNLSLQAKADAARDEKLAEVELSHQAILKQAQHEYELLWNQLEEKITVESNQVENEAKHPESNHNKLNEAEQKIASLSRQLKGLRDQHEVNLEQLQAKHLEATKQYAKQTLLRVTKQAIDRNDELRTPYNIRRVGVLGGVLLAGIGAANFWNPIGWALIIGGTFTALYVHFEARKLEKDINAKYDVRLALLEPKNSMSSAARSHQALGISHASTSVPATRPAPVAATVPTITGQPALTLVQSGNNLSSSLTRNTRQDFAPS